MPIFDYAHPKIIEATLSFPEFPPAFKKSFHSIRTFLRYCEIVTRLATPNSDHAQSKMFDQLLIYVNLYQHAKNQAIS